MPLKACAECGSPRLRAPTPHDGHLTGLLPAPGDIKEIMVCLGCGHIGLPLLFPSGKEQDAFFLIRRPPPGKAPPPQEQ